MKSKLWVKSEEVSLSHGPAPFAMQHEKEAEREAVSDSTTSGHQCQIQGEQRGCF